MQNREYYDLENGIHSMKIPRTGRYQLILAGYGYGDSKGAKIQMDMSFIKVRGLQDTEIPHFGIIQKGCLRLARFRLRNSWPAFSRSSDSEGVLWNCTNVYR